MAGLFAVLIVPLWMALWSGQVTRGGPFAPVDWHIHEMLFGCSSAAMVASAPAETGLWAAAALWTAGIAAFTLLCAPILTPVDAGRKRPDPKAA